MMILMPAWWMCLASSTMFLNLTYENVGGGYEICSRMNYEHHLVRWVPKCPVHLNDSICQVHSSIPPRILTSAKAQRG